MNIHYYDDIIDLPHHVSAKRKPMSLSDRAAQFASFAALTGYEEAVKETARRTDKWIELGESELYALNEKITLLRENIQQRPFAQVTYFKPDKYKSGGSYITVNGKIRRIDAISRRIIFCDGFEIDFDSVSDIML